MCKSGASQNVPRHVLPVCLEAIVTQRRTFSEDTIDRIAARILTAVLDRLPPPGALVPFS